MAMVGPLATFFVTAYRPERAPEMTHLLNGHLMDRLHGGVRPVRVWAVAVGLAILSDTTSTPIYPRWSGFSPSPSA